MFFIFKTARSFLFFIRNIAELVVFFLKKHVLNLLILSTSRKLRSRTYESLLFWLSASRSACGLTKYVDILLSQVLSDVVVQRDTVHLQSGKPPSVFRPECSLLPFFFSRDEKWIFL